MKPHLSMQEPKAQARAREIKVDTAVFKFFLCYNIIGWRKKTHIQHFLFTFQKQ